MQIFSGNHRKVICLPDDVTAFNAKWPGSTLRDRAYWFEFDSAGDLVDTDVPEHDDGPAATALAEDAKQFLNAHWAHKEFESAVDRAFANAPYAVEFQSVNSRGQETWHVLARQNGSILVYGASPADCVEKFERQAVAMRKALAMVLREGS